MLVWDSRITGASRDAVRNALCVAVGSKQLSRGSGTALTDAARQRMSARTPGTHEHETGRGGIADG